MKNFQKQLRQKKISALAVLFAALGLGASMPSCPGNQAVQQQVDSLQAKLNEQIARNQSLEAKIQGLTKDMTDVKTLLTQVSNAVLEQKREIDELKASPKKATPPQKTPSNAKSAKKGASKGKKK